MVQSDSSPLEHVSGYVLVGGKSSRFGSDKTKFEINGVSMVCLVEDNMYRAIGSAPLFVGSSTSHSSINSTNNLQGVRENSGPLGALCDVMEFAQTTFVVVAPCDTPHFSAPSFSALISAMDNADVCVATDDGQDGLHHWLLSCWHIDRCKDHLVRAFYDGERSIHKAVVGLAINQAYFPAHQLINVNTPGDIA